MIRVGTSHILKKNDGAWFLPWLLAVVVYLGTMATVGIVMVDKALESWREVGQSIVTVELPIDTREEQVAETVDFLRDYGAVTSAHVISRDEMLVLLEPWFPATDLIRKLSLPWLIEVVVDGGDKVDWKTIEKLVSDRIPGALFINGADWSDNLAKPVRLIQGIAVFVLILIIGSTIAAVSLTARATLAIDRNSLALMHLLGASDTYIVKEFQSKVIGMAVRGGLVGVVLAAATFYSIDFVFRYIDPSLIPNYALGARSWLAMTVTPILTVLIALFTVRRIVLRTMARMF